MKEPNKRDVIQSSGTYTLHRSNLPRGTVDAVAVAAGEVNIDVFSGNLGRKITRYMCLGRSLYHTESINAAGLPRVQPTVCLHVFARSLRSFTVPCRSAGGAFGPLLCCCVSRSALVVKMLYKECGGRGHEERDRGRWRDAAPRGYRRGHQEGDGPTRQASARVSRRSPACGLTFSSAAVSLTSIW